MIVEATFDSAKDTITVVIPLLKDRKAGKMPFDKTLLAQTRGAYLPLSCVMPDGQEVLMQFTIISRPPIKV